MSRTRHLSGALALCAVLMAAATAPVLATAGPGAAAVAGAARPDRLQVVSVSNPRPGLVSGGEVLVRVSLPAGVRADTVRVTADRRDVTAAFEVQEDGTLLGLVTGLRDGENLVAARVAGPDREEGRQAAVLRVVNHPITGPVFSGPQQVPFFCQTTAFGLAPATMPLCSAPTVVSYVYHSSTGRFFPLADPTAPPSDVTMATVGGRQVPEVVRVERGTIDRAVYEIAALFDGRSPDPLHPDTAWNRRLVYTFGGGCDAGFHQGTVTGGVLNDLFLSQGYAVASSTLNVLNNNCSTVISAEAAMMVKEHFIETYGPVAHTIGWGGSGGAIQQYDIADAYPGILDGIIPGVSFPDPLSTIGPVTDCRLLDHFFGASGNGFTPAQMLAVSGFGSYHSCVSWDATFANRVTATGSCDSSIPVSVRWDPVTNPNGVKCSAAEQMVNQLGRDPRTGFARSPLDNVGVQYGLAALDAGQITPEQFVELNQGVGGYDFAGNLVARRSSADPIALHAAYADDLVLDGGLGLATTPIIDQRTYLDATTAAAADIHTTQWSFIIRQRLIEEGDVANQVIIENAIGTIGQASVYELSAMDRWLTAIDADRSSRPLGAKIGADRPADLGDGCFVSAAQRVLEPLSYRGTGQCASLFPAFADTRLVAGEALTENVLKCRLRPLDLASYPVTFTSDQAARLRATFPQGVCDYRRRGQGEVAPRGTWLSYGDRTRA
ncbi:MAG TPA: DUF6351 family protein [Candidatus Dormibacteraeota bacterium]|nr:DUF6351 family protein [Candidatus Dormibacteraeota bacterium]